MILGRGRGRTRAPAFFLGGQGLPRVKTYTYLGVCLRENLSWKGHIDLLLARGERKMAACLFWTKSADLPLSFVERIYQTYVHSSVSFGLAFVSAGTQVAPFQTRVLQWGRRLLCWPRGSPNLAVQGQLGWHDAETMRLIQAAGLWARLLSLPPGCCAGQLARSVDQHPSSWVSSVSRDVTSAGVPHPVEWGIHAGCAGDVVKKWLQHARLILVNRSHARYASNSDHVDSLQLYSQWQPLPRLHPVAYGRSSHAHHVRFWGLARCGHHDFADGRAARHRGCNSDAPCRFCASGADTLAHALSECPVHNVARRRWCQQTRGRNDLSLHTLFCTDPAVNTAGDILRNVAFVGTVCQAAAACEM